MSFRAEKSPMHPGIYVLVGLLIGSGLSFLSSGGLAFALLVVSVLGLIVMLGMWYFREGDIPIGGMKRHHQSHDHVSSAMRDSAWDSPLDFKRK